MSGDVIAAPILIAEKASIPAIQIWGLDGENASRLQAAKNAPEDAPGSSTCSMTWNIVARSIRVLAGAQPVVMFQMVAIIQAHEDQPVADQVVHPGGGGDPPVHSIMADDKQGVISVSKSGQRPVQPTTTPCNTKRIRRQRVLGSSKGRCPAARARCGGPPTHGCAGESADSRENTCSGLLPALARLSTFPCPTTFDSKGPFHQVGPHPGEALYLLGL